MEVHHSKRESFKTHKKFMKSVISKNFSYNYQPSISVVNDIESKAKVSHMSRPVLASFIFILFLKDDNKINTRKEIIVK